MAEQNAAVLKALAMMAARKKKADAAGQQAADAAGTPAAMMGQDNSYVGPDASNADGQDPRALMEQQNNQLAQELLKKQQKRIKGY